jgi:hypothetical protein
MAAQLSAEQAEIERAAVAQAEAEQLEAQEAAELALELAAALDDVPAQDDHSAAHAASMLTELNREAPVAAAPAAPEPDEEPAAPVEAAPVDTGPAPMVARDHADTAMLLRELSSLGFGMDDSPPATPAPSSRPPSSAPPVDPKKKRKGLFGRG